MTHLADGRSEFARPRAGNSRGLLQRVCTENPFYVLSALLVCVGFWVSFGSQAQAAQTWALLCSMAGYTLLLSVTACLLVRFVGVWDDVRTLLLLVVLMFLATSVTFDEVLARNPSRGILCYLVGLGFAIAVSEGMLRSIRLRLPELFRVPYYLILALFFLYPVAITPLLDRPWSESLFWALYGFSPVAGLAFLTLLPAVRRGRSYVKNNGSPWNWAWYPWTLFGVLAFSAAARSALLCWSMHHVPSGEAEPYIFGLYFFAPFLFAIGVLVLEIGLVERHRGAINTALAFPVVVVVLSMLGHHDEPFYQMFLSRFTTRLGGTPLYLALLASAGFFAYASLRRVRSATDALSLALLALLWVAPDSLDLDYGGSPRPLPLLLVAVVQLALGLRRQNAWRCLVGACCLVFAMSLVLPGGSTGAHRGPILFHLLLIAVLIVGALFDNDLGRYLRGIGATMAVLGSLVVIAGRFSPSATIPAWGAAVYPLMLAVILAVYGYALKDRIPLGAVALILLSWLIGSGWRAYSALRQIVTGVDYIVIGMVLFLLAVLTSMAKGGVLPWSITRRESEVAHPPD